MRSLLRVTLTNNHRDIELRRIGMDHSRRSIASPSALEIAQDERDAGFYLLSMSEGRCTADSFHLTLNDAKHQASTQFGVAEEEWIDAT